VPESFKVAAQRFGVQLRERARRKLSKPNDLAREAVSCNTGLGSEGDVFCIRTQKTTTKRLHQRHLPFYIILWWSVIKQPDMV
jgi:hypothetical protein